MKKNEEASNSSHHMQLAKEEARRHALKLGLALERRGNTIEIVSTDGSRQVLVESKSPQEAWPAALAAILTKLAEKDVEKSTLELPKISKITVFSDGGSRGNPGPSASGFALYDAETNQLIEEGGEYLGITTNNQAEYHSIRLALEQAVNYQAEEITAYMDSLLVVNQLNGVYKVKNRDLWPVHQAIKNLSQQFKSVRFLHIPREQNKVADAVVNRILDNNSA